MDLRPFVIYGDKVKVLKGGLTRVALEKFPHSEFIARWRQQGYLRANVIDVKMLSSSADSIYWMARYIERAGNTARLLHVNSLFLIDARINNLSQNSYWLSVLEATSLIEEYNHYSGKRRLQERHNYFFGPRKRNC